MRSLRRTPLLERLWWDLESLTWDDQLADEAKQADVQTVVDWLTAEEQGAKDRVLDIGCGTGNYAIALAKRGFGVTGIDVSQAMLRRGRTKAAQSGVEVKFLKVDLHQGLPFPDMSFEWLLCVHVLQVVRGPETFLRDAHRVLVPGGRLALVAFDGTGSGTTTPCTTTRTKRRRAFSIVKNAVISRSRRICFYSPVELATLIEDAGFHAVEQPVLPGRPAVIARRAS